MTAATGKVGQVIRGAKATRTWLRAHAALVVFALLCALAVLWLLEHDARLKQEVELKHLRRETATEVAALRERAERAIADHRENAKVIRDLETRRASLEREAEELRQRLSFLRKEERVRVQQASTAGHVELSAQDASPLGPEEFGVRDSGLGTRGLKGNSRFQIRDSNEIGRKETSKPSLAGGPESAPSNHKSPAPSSKSLSPSRETRVPSPELTACREQSAVQGQLISNCEERVDASQAVIDAMNRSVQDLEQTVRAKDEIAARLDAQHRAELRAARGSRWKRFTRAAKYVGAGVVIGIVAAH